ncbi:multiple inositol polyphosphate phosphatase 1 [Calliphora vicina]|uniref:multiple inositol polyphosphate phosphatase 1 n=1 Tax=Calliphora vicina TaxID=7373 RepID=UPI00325AE6F8
MFIRLFVVVFTFLIYKISVTAGDNNNNVVGTLSLKETEFCNEIPRADIEQYLSTKTPYRVVANLDDKPINYPGCHATRIWSVIRHGTRNPGKKVIARIKTQLKSLRDHILAVKDVEMCPKQLESLSKWNFTVTAEEEKYLVAEGEDELIELAERMQNRFPMLLPETYNPKQYFFKYTATQRTLKSAQSFATGLFGRHRIGNIIYPEALHKDPVLRFYKLCSRWKTDVDKNPQTFDNVRKFLQTDHMLDVLKHLRKKTKLSNIDAHTARLIYTVCAFETAWQRRKEPSVWCQLLDRKSIQILEFAEDLEYYWNDGYGYELTHQIACPAIADMFEHIDPLSTLPNSTFYFTHSGTLLKVLAHLGLYKDEAPLTYQDYGKQRKWRTSAIDAFATNVAFVLYDCQNEGPKVLTLHQEQVVHIPGCPVNNDLCSLNTLRKLFAHSLDNCNFNEMCAF